MGVKRFVWDEVSDNVLLETDETDTVTARYCQRPEKFGELLFQDRGGTKNFYHYDGNASTCNLTDSSEAVTDTTLFTAYGDEVSSSGSTANPFGYKGAVGYYTNESTSDIYVRNRSYEPILGRWWSKDPLGFVDGPNLYQAYFVPNGIDPTGLEWVYVGCRFLRYFGILTLQRHCWIQCTVNGSIRRYSLLNRGGTATPVRNAPEDLVSGDGYAYNGDCCCIERVFALNEDKRYPYDKDDCNSNYFVSALLKCCGITAIRPTNAYGWGNCDRKEGMVDCGNSE